MLQFFSCAASQELAMLRTGNAPILACTFFFLVSVALLKSYLALDIAW